MRECGEGRHWVPAVLAGGIVLAGAVLAACGGAGGSSVEKPAGEQAVPVRTATPEVADVVDAAVLAADLLPLRRAVLAAEVPGVVEALHFEEGQRVREGDLLAEIDTRALKQALAEAEALHRRAEDQYRRAEALFERRSITRERLVDATAERDVAAARLESARLQLEKSRLEAPWAGRIAEKRVEEGDYAVPGQPLAELVDVSRLKVRAPAPAADVPFLEVGAPVTIRVAALPGEELQGRVVRLAAELDPGARTLDVEAEIDNAGGRLKPGMLARLEVPLRTLPDAVLVPLPAVVDLGDARVVYVVEGERAHRRTVELGPETGGRVAVLSGIAPEDRVVVEGAQGIADGQLVTEAAGR